MNSNQYNQVPYVEVNSVTIHNGNPLTEFWGKKVKRLTQELLKLPQADVMFVHEFVEGKYIRTMIAPPNTVITGAEHKTPYHVSIKKGTIAVNVDGTIKTLEAPFEMDVPAGMERAGVTFEEEVVWVDTYDNPTNCQDIIELEEMLFVVTEDGLLNHKPLLDGSSREVVLLEHKKEGEV